MTRSRILAPRMQRQHLTTPATAAEYDALYRDLSPGCNVYWNGFGDPPTLTYRADFDDKDYNRQRQTGRALLKLRLIGGNLGWIPPEDLELFAGAYRKPLLQPSGRQAALLELVEREGPLTIQQMKAETGLLVKEITPALHRLQEAFLLYEDQNEGQDDRGWGRFGEMFPDADLEKYSRAEALRVLLRRFAYRLVWFDLTMASSYYKLPGKEIRAAAAALVSEGILTQQEDGYLWPSGEDAPPAEPPPCVLAMHRNDFLVKADEAWLKKTYLHSYPDTLYYLLIDGAWHGAAVGKFRYSPEVSDVLLDLPPDEARARKDEITAAIQRLSGKAPERFLGEPLR
ncbi:MAG: hypothetical protein LBJ11_03610 [Oscillospiraceae bacterium]|nr:hypothetical protein [Oscillospiraceae bacterium]